jgi:hypothetical protein
MSYPMRSQRLVGWTNVLASRVLYGVRRIHSVRVVVCNSLDRLESNLSWWIIPVGRERRELWNGIHGNVGSTPQARASC